MAVVRGAYGGSQIKGSIAGTTFQQGPFGQVIRNRTVPVNPNTAGQVAVRTALALCSSYWSHDMTSDARLLWKGYADLTPLPDRFGTTQKVSGRAMFMRTNINNLLAGTNIVADAPGSPGIAPTSIPTLTIVAATGIKLTGLTIDPVGGGTFQISLSPPVGDANVFFKGPFGTGHFITDAADLPVTLLPSASLHAGQFYFMRYRSSDAQGKVSNITIQKIGPLT